MLGSKTIAGEGVGGFFADGFNIVDWYVTVTTAIGGEEIIGL